MLEENQFTETDFVNDTEADELEKKYVNQVYEEIADHFSSTRYKAWPKVAEFLKNVLPGSLILDVGCGNGKNMNLSNGCYEIGLDFSLNLAKFSSQKNEVLVADCLKLPIRNDCADVVICIAVIHHMSTKERRQKALKEILRVLRSKGKCLVYVWAMEQEGPKGSSSYLKKNQLKLSNASSVEEIKFLNSRTIQVPVHENRTKFSNTDLLVPFKTGSKVKHRFYHLFQKGELESLTIDCGFSTISSYYDEGNWCALLEK